MKTYGARLRSCRAILVALLPVLPANSAFGWKDDSDPEPDELPSDYHLHLAADAPEAKLTIERGIIYHHAFDDDLATSEITGKMVQLNSADFVDLRITSDDGLVPYEVEIKLTGPFDDHGDLVVDKETPSELSLLVMSAQSGQYAGPVYRELLVSPKDSWRHYEIIVQNLTWSGYAEKYRDWFNSLPGKEQVEETESGSPSDELRHEGDSGAWCHYRLDVTLRPVHTCSMSARVTGDVNDTFFGDVAYFNALEKGVANAAGTAVDPEMRALAENFTSGMFEFAVKARREGLDVPLPENPEGESFADFLDRELGGTDTFGLTLHDFKIEGNEVPSDIAEVIGVFAGGFSLGVSGIDVTEGPQPPDVPRKIQINSVRAAVGVVNASSVQQIAFELVDGTSSFAMLNVMQPNPYFVYGTFEGRLVTRKEYQLQGESTSRRLSIHLQANFTALQGAMTCVEVRQ